VKARLLAPVAAALCLAGVSPAQQPGKLLSTPIARVGNQELANAVAARLQQGGLRGYTIDISASSGIVDLSGRVADKAQHDAVIEAALGVTGVKSVMDSLTVSPIQKVEALTEADPATLPPPYAGPGGPIVDPIPVTSPVGAAPYDLNPPKLPPYAWPTYAPYNNFSRVAYPGYYPYNAWPFVGPFYPFPKVPLGWRSVSLEWQDGHWYYGRNATKHDYWRVRYW
jgi:hypothetical protein